MAPSDDLLREVARFDAIDLATLDERAALQRRVDTKYVVPAERVAEVFAALHADYRALEIDGRRAFRYESAYFDTSDLECFRAHVEDRAPRFKVRTRFYADTGACALEVKVKHAGGETVKESTDYDPEVRDRLTPEARKFVDRVLGEQAPDELEPSLTTRFRRSTLAQRDGAERVTVDVDLELVRPDGATARLHEPCAVLESKTADGEGRCDQLLRAAGFQPMSMSKYRTGIALLVAGDPHPPSPDPRELFVTRTRVP